MSSFNIVMQRFLSFLLKGKKFKESKDDFNQSFSELKNDYENLKKASLMKEQYLTKARESWNREKFQDLKKLVQGTHEICKKQIKILRKGKNNLKKNISDANSINAALDDYYLSIHFKVFLPPESKRILREINNIRIKENDIVIQIRKHLSLLNNRVKEIAGNNPYYHGLSAFNWNLMSFALNYAPLSNIQRIMPMIHELTHLSLFLIGKNSNHNQTNRVFPLLRQSVIAQLPDMTTIKQARITYGESTEDINDTEAQQVCMMVQKLYICLFPLLYYTHLKYGDVMLF